MCNLCADALDKYYPYLSEEEQLELLWGATPFSMGDGEIIAKQIKELYINTDGSLSQALAYADAQLDKAMETRNDSETSI